MPETTIAGSPLRSGLAVLGSLAAVAVGAEISISSHAITYEVLGVVGAAFFLVAAISWAVNMVARGPVVTIGPKGIRDRRLSSEWIPWMAINVVRTESIGNVRSVVLDLDPAFQSKMRATPLGWLQLKLNGPFGYPGLWINATGLKGGFDRLGSAVEHGWASAHATDAAPPDSGT